MKTFTKTIMTFLAVISLTILVIFLLIWGISPIVIRNISSSALAEHNLIMNKNSHVRYNPFWSYLTVSDLQLQLQDKKVVSIEQLELELNIHEILFGKIKIKKFILQGAFVEITIHEKESQSSIQVAGFHLKQSPSKPREKSTLESQVSESTYWPLSQRLLAPSIELKNITLSVNDGHKQNTVELKRLLIEETSIDKETQNLALMVEAIFQQGQFKLSSTIALEGFKGKIKTSMYLKDLIMDDFSSYLVEQPIDFISGKLSFAVQHELSIQDNLLPTVSQLSGDLQLDDFSLKNQKNSQVMTEWDKLLINDARLDINLDKGLNTLDMGLSEVIINNITSSRNEGIAGLPPLSTIDKIKLDDIRFQNNTLSIDQVSLNNFYKHILLGKNRILKNFILADNIAKKQAESSTVSTQDTESTNDELIFVINKIVFNGENIVYFRDESVAPTYERTLYVDKFELTNITSHKNHQANFIFQGRSNQYAKIDLSGYVYPFSNKVNGHLEGKIQEVSLPSISSYIREPLGFDLKSGSLDTKLNITISESELSGKSSLLIRGLETSQPTIFNNNNLKKQTPIPLNIALEVLKDKRGNIKLEVPLAGNIDDPSFGINSIFNIITRKVIMLQAQHYILQTFVPYANVLSVAMSTKDMILKVRFKDLIYQPGVVSLMEAEKAYADQFIALMNDKPKAQVKICSISTQDDLLLPMGATKQGVLTPEQIEKLRSIAKQRSDNFKAYAVTVGKIESDRILICNPDVTMKPGEKPKIQFSF